MLPLLLGAGTFALVALTNTDDTPATTDRWEEIDAALHGGRLREENLGTANNWTSEQSRIVRPAIGRKPIMQGIREWVDYHRAKNRALRDLHAFNQITDNQKILRADILSHTRLPLLPDSTFTEWKSVPNAYFDYATPPTGDFRGDCDYSKYDDQVGHAGGMPIRGNEYVWLPATYFGNPWGPEGQLYNGLRSKLVNNSAYGPVPEKLKQDKRVRFGGLPMI